MPAADDTCLIRLFEELLLPQVFKGLRVVTNAIAASFRASDAAAEWHDPGSPPTSLGPAGTDCAAAAVRSGAVAPQPRPS